MTQVNVIKGRIYLVDADSVVPINVGWCKLTKTISANPA